MMSFHKNRSLTNGLPQMDSTFDFWELPLVLIRVKQQIVEGKRVQTESRINFKAVIQPFTTEKLQSLPDGQRSWEWIWIHTRVGATNLNTSDKVIYNGKRYKIMTVKDYSAYSFIEYEAVADYNDEI